MSAVVRGSRSRSYIDPGVQGSLLRKLCVHWALLVTVNCIVFGAWIWLFERADASASDAVATAFGKCLPFLVTSGALLPIFLLDTLRLTSRFAGPALRLRAALSDAADGRPVRPLQFRHDDFWHEMAESFNTLIQRKEEAERLAQENRIVVDAANPIAGVDKSRLADRGAVSTVRSADQALCLLDAITP